MTTLAAGACSASPRAGSPPAVDHDAYQEIQFTRPDGAVRSGRVFGDGPVAVVLSYMAFRPDNSQDDWAPFATELADNGYRVLTYARGGLTDVWQDVLAAADYLRQHGAKKVIAGGASLGAMASLRAAGAPDANLDGALWLSGILQWGEYDFGEADVSGLRCPLFFASGDQDSYAADSARQMHAWSTAPSELLTLRTGAHGTDILANGGAEADKLRKAMLRYVSRVAGVSTTC
ncbi:MAG: alpha/beta hydrolase family protein [Haloechinothrix sp.]